MRLATIEYPEHRPAADRPADASPAAETAGTAAAIATEEGYLPLPDYRDIGALLADLGGLDRPAPFASDGPLAQAARTAGQPTDTSGTAAPAGQPTGTSGTAGSLRTGALVPTAAARLRQPVLAPSKVLCIGLNYRNHIAETGMPTPEFPTVFAKFASSLTGPFDPITAPPEDPHLDFEGELAIVIGAHVRRANPATAAQAIAGYTVANDVSMRTYQLRTQQWLAGKMWEASSPVGPVMVSTDSFDPTTATLTTRVNGEVRQQDSTADLVFGPAALVSELSTIIALAPGDLILTGTPAGVGMADERWLAPGDEVSVEISGIGTISNRIAAAEM